MTTETCWICNSTLQLDLRICGGCYQERYEVAQRIRGKPAIQRRRAHDILDKQHK